MNDVAGTFIGTVAISLSIAELENFFSSLDLEGRTGIVSLVHSDGVILARGGPTPESKGFTGTRIGNAPFFSGLQQSSWGSYWNTSAISSRFEGIRRLISYRAVSGLPLIAVVGRADKTIFQQADASFEKYVLISVVLTGAVLLVVIMAARRQAQMLSTSTELQCSKQSLDETKQFLDSIIENIPVSVVVKDAATRKYILVNRAFESMIELPRHDLLGRTVFDIFRIEDAEFMNRADTRVRRRAEMTPTTRNTKSKNQKAASASKARDVSSFAMTEETPNISSR